MAQNDSLDKVIPTYFGAFATVPFVWKNKEYRPRTLRVSPHLARGLSCPPMCGGCCPKFSLDYLPFEDKPYDLVEREVTILGKTFSVFSDTQKGNYTSRCKNVRLDDGRCSIHGKQPFSCDFEIIRVKHFNDLTMPNQVLTAPYGRGWQLFRVDNKMGALCGIEDATQENANEAARKLRRLKGWMEYFEIPHKCDRAIAYLENGEWKNNQPIFIN
jgi:Fe-S-cluster containining protein